VADGAEGGVNFVHGLPEWAVSTILIRDNEPVLAVVYQPVPDLTWTAVRGGGAQRNGQPLHTSAKTSLDAAITRHPGRLDLPAGDQPNSDRLLRVAADVLDPEQIAAALKGAQVVLSGLGLADGEHGDVRLAGAGAVVAAQPEYIVWMGAFGTGASARAAGWLTRTLLNTFMRAELPDRVGADQAVLAAGGVVFHCGPLSDGPLSPDRRTLDLPGAPRRLFPARVSRATVAAMLDEAETRAHPGQTLIPVDR
jgi:hypothetical protein